MIYLVIFIILIKKFNLLNNNKTLQGYISNILFMWSYKSLQITQNFILKYDYKSINKQQNILYKQINKNRYNKIINGMNYNYIKNCL